MTACLIVTLLYMCDKLFAFIPIPSRSLLDRISSLQEDLDRYISQGQLIYATVVPKKKTESTSRKTAKNLIALSKDQKSRRNICSSKFNSYLETSLSNEKKQQLHFQSRTVKETCNHIIKNLHLFSVPSSASMNLSISTC